MEVKDFSSHTHTRPPKSYVDILETSTKFQSKNGAHFGLYRHHKGPDGAYDYDTREDAKWLCRRSLHSDYEGLV